MSMDPHPSDEPILDAAYLDDMCEWVGADVLAALLESAPEALMSELAALRTAWDRADLIAVQDAGHRIKGAAGSVACKRLASLGHTAQMLPELDDRAVLVALESAAEKSSAALADYHASLSARLAQDTPVPPNPQ